MATKVSEFAAKLRAMKEAWKVGREPEPVIPDAIYEFVGQSVTLKETKNGDKLMIVREHLLCGDSEFAGNVLRDNIVFSEDDPRSMRRVAEYIEKMGYEIPEEINALPEIIAEISGAGIHYMAKVVTQKNDDRYKNIYIEHVIDEAEASAPSGTEAKTEEEVEDTQLAVGDVVSFELDGNVVEGTITGQDEEGNVEVEVDGTTYAVPPEGLTKSGGDDSSGANGALSDLLAIATAHDIPVDDQMDLDAVVAEMKKHQWKKSDLTEDEQAILQENGVPLVSATAVKKVMGTAARKTVPVAVKKPAPAQVSRKPQTTKKVVRKK